MRRLHWLVLLVILSAFLGACDGDSGDPNDGDSDVPVFDGDVDLSDGDADDAPDGDLDGDEPDGDADGDIIVDGDGEETPPDGDATDGDEEETLPCDNPRTYFNDQDADGFGDPDDSVLACEQPDGYVENANDCAPNAGYAYPGSHETETPGDGIDTDCDGFDVCRDLNCDGWPDVVFAQTRDGEQYDYTSVIYFGSADGFKAENKQEIATMGAVGVDAGDFDKDGYVDLVFASEQNGVVRTVNSTVYYGGAGGINVARKVDLPSIGAADAVVVDLDDDGWLDILIANRYRGPIPSTSTYTNNSYIYNGGPNGFTAFDRVEFQTIGAANGWVGDLNGDGYNEVVFSAGVNENYTTQSYLYWGAENGWNEGNRWSFTSVYAEGLLVADLNGDQYKDVFLTTTECLLSCSKSSRIYWGSVDGPNVSSYKQVEGLVGAVDAKAADVDRDGTVDLIVANGDDEAMYSYVYFGTAAGYLEENREEFTALSAQEVAVGDLDGNGYVDLVFASSRPIDEQTPEVSQIYFNFEDGFARGNPTLLPTHNAAAVTVVGSVYRP